MKKFSLINIYNKTFLLKRKRVKCSPGMSAEPIGCKKPCHHNKPPAQYFNINGIICYICIR